MATAVATALDTLSLASDPNDNFARVLRGDFSADVMKAVLKEIPSAKLVVFVSSTFTDTYQERNALMYSLYLNIYYLFYSSYLFVYLFIYLIM